MHVSRVDMHTHTHTDVYSLKPLTHSVPQHRTAPDSTVQRATATATTTSPQHNIATARIRTHTFAARFSRRMSGSIRYKCLCDTTCLLDLDNTRFKSFTLPVRIALIVSSAWLGITSAFALLLNHAVGINLTMCERGQSINVRMQRVRMPCCS